MFFQKCESHLAIDGGFVLQLYKGFYGNAVVLLEKYYLYFVNKMYLKWYYDENRTSPI